MLLTQYHFVFKLIIFRKLLEVVNGDLEVVNAQNHDFYFVFNRNDSCVMCEALFGVWGIPKRNCDGSMPSQFLGIFGLKKKGAIAPFG